MRTMRTSLLISLFVCGSFVGCKARAPQAPVVATAPAAVAANTIPEAPYIHSIPETMKQEAASRPTGTPRAEDLVGALKNKGLKFSDPKQVLANKWGARYCSMTIGASGVEVMVCEFASDAAATQGRDFSTKAFGSIANRDLHLNRKTVLTVLRGTSDPPVTAEAKSVSEVFAGL